MSFAVEHVKAVDGQLEQLLLSRLNLASEPDSVAPLHLQSSQDVSAAAREKNLQGLIRQLSISSSNRPSLQSTWKLRDALSAIKRPDEVQTLDGTESVSESAYEDELEWFLVAKVANHVYGHVLQALVNETLPLSNDMWYWSEILNSPSYMALYSAQTSPIRAWKWSKSIYEEVSNRGISLSNGWQQFYGHVRKVAQERSLANVQRQLAAPWAFVTEDIHSKLTSLRISKLVNASAIGYLLSNGFDDESLRIDNYADSGGWTASREDQWKVTIMKSVSAIDAVLALVQKDAHVDQDAFGEAVTEVVADDPLASDSSLSDGVKPRHAAARLQDIVVKGLPLFTEEARLTLKKNSKPSRTIRYWIPTAILLLSASTLLRIVVNRKAEIVQWIRELGSTVIDFWRNWVIEPTRKIIGTIRHDEASEVSITSKKSLEGDRASLERMVIDFAVDSQKGTSLSATDIANLRFKVHEGDLTPVLRAYEQDLKSPLYGSIRGNLIRALLIQVQKTKVDVEIAMGGIDNLLKSQELVFGFVGLTPGVLVSFGIFRWLGSFSTTRKDLQRGKKQSQTFQILRNIDRVLTGAPQSDAGMLSFKDYGLLVCEAIVLRDIAFKIMPKETFREFCQDFNDLIDNNSGVGRQLRVADRIRWAYGKWL